MKHTYNISLLEKYLQQYNVKIVSEYKFCPDRKYRADYAIPDWRLFNEIDGSLYYYKAHGSITGILRDIEKYNLASVHGFSVLRFTPQEFAIDCGIQLINQWRIKHYENT